MELSPSWERASCAIIQGLSNILCNTRRFIAVFTKVLRWSLSSARSIQSIPPHPILSDFLVVSSILAFPAI
jgi:hypothetical protein